MKTIIAQRGRSLSPKRTEYGKVIRKDYENHRVYEHRANMQRYEPRHDGICNCITTILKDNLTLRKAGKMATMIVKEPTETEKGAVNIVKEVDIEDQEIEKTIEDYLYTAKDGEQYGIFKLSPRECLRLMDVRDEDIDKMLAVNSNSQCYRQAGNSIVVSVIAAIFSQLNIQGIKPWNERTMEEKREFAGWKKKEEL